MTHDKVRVEELDLDASALELAAERLRPGREEGLAARVDGEERRRDEGRERADVEDQATLARDHARNDNLGHLEGGVAARASLPVSIEAKEGMKKEASRRTC